MLKKHYWHPLPQVVNYVESLTPTLGKVIDIGGNATHRFRPAQDVIGWGGDIKLDFECDPLPYQDEEVAFAYCRHTLEDLAYPEHLLREIARTSQGGYIETPSPLAELSRGIDADYSGHRGYRHHRWIVWSYDGYLNFIPKYPLVEQMRGLSRHTLLSQGSTYWNTHHAWTGKLQYRIWRHELDYNLAAYTQRWYGLAPTQYEACLLRAIDESVDSCSAFAEKVSQPQGQPT